MAPELLVGGRAPEFALPSTQGDTSLSKALEDGRRLVLAFFAEGGTPTCNTELEMLRDAHEMLSEFRATVLGVSADTIAALQETAERLALPLALASDASLEMARAYGVVDADGPRALRAIFVIGADRTIMLRIVPFQPANVSQFEAIFAVLGAE